MISGPPVRISRTPSTPADDGLGAALGFNYFLGFDYFMVSCATPGTPIELRQRMMTRFAEEVCPRYSSAMRRTKAA